MKKVKVAVIGYGHLGKWHCQKVQALPHLAEFVAIVEKSPVGQESAKQSHPQVMILEDLSQVIDKIDAAFIVTPTSVHHDLVLQLMKAGKHVFCEKPLCSNDSEGQSIAQLARNSSLVLQVGHSERFHEAWEKLRPYFQKISSPFSLRINRIAPFKGRATDVDVVQDLAIHDLDLLLFLFQQRPVALKAFGHKIRTNKWDHVTIQLELENQSHATIVVGRNGVKEVRDLEVISQDGMTQVDLFSNRILTASPKIFDDGQYVHDETYSKRDHLLLEHENFYQSILNHRPAIIGLNDGLNAVHLVDCALKSLEAGHSVRINLV